MTQTPDTHAVRIAHAREICRQAGKRFTPLRAHIFDLIVAAGEPVKAYGLLERLEPEHGSPEPPTVYRALEFFSKLGLIHRVEALNAYVPCSHVHSSHAAEFFICNNCERVQERNADDHMNCVPEGFTVSRSVIEHYGNCGQCKTA
ncbi:MAG: transcriptional repressor [Hyphomonadaceae bacterium]|nr:transcriptional repressor [Hyphomonadaceae bacterium]MBC6412266.1 transcriptional repressor [Hyphomonadaceae bacterium]